ncbi:MAG: periplasmic heavy metal sensor [Pseudomonadota bacterium]
MSVETRSVRTSRILLFASLTLNFVLIGLIAGAILRGPFIAPVFPPGLDGEFRVLQQALPADTKRAFRRALVGRRSEFESHAREIRSMRREFVGLLRSETLDVAAINAVVTRQQAEWSALADVARDMMIGYLETLTPDQRREIADNVDAWIAERSKRMRAKGD